MGQFNLILGCMFSGKTSELHNRFRRYNIGGKKCLMVKYKNDTRYGDTAVVTHDGIRIEAIPCVELAEVDEMVKGYDVICIDEIQFYKDADMFCDKWANEGKIVEACGLNGQFNRKQWPMISKLIPLVENLTFKKAVCVQTGNDATFTQRLSNDQNSELIGGSELYRAVSRDIHCAATI